MNHQESMEKFGLPETHMPDVLAARIINDNFKGLSYQQADSVIEAMNEMLYNMRMQENITISEEE